MTIFSRSCWCCCFSYRKMQESSSSHSIPHVALSSDSKAPSISYSASHTTDMNSAPSTNTPQFKKKLLTDKTQSSSTPRESGSHIAKHQSFDYAKSTCLYSPIRNVLSATHTNTKFILYISCFCSKCVYLSLNLSMSRFTHGLVSTIW